MDVEFFIHGVPDGNDFFGLAEDRMYFDSFYSGEAENRLLIQTRISGGILYCYYNYLIGKNVISYSGRQGSYFGITLRLDQYCIDFSKIYLYGLRPSEYDGTGMKAAALDVSLGSISLGIVFYLF